MLANLTEASDWRVPLQPDGRQRLVNKITETLKRHVSVSAQEEGSHELWKIAQRFEERIFIVATSLSDYLQKISFKMLIMERLHPKDTTGNNNIPSNHVGPSNKPPNPGFGMQYHVHNQAQFHA